MTRNNRAFSLNSSAGDAGTSSLGCCGNVVHFSHIFQQLIGMHSINFFISNFCSGTDKVGFFHEVQIGTSSDESLHNLFTFSKSRKICSLKLNFSSSLGFFTQSLSSLVDNP